MPLGTVPPLPLEPIGETFGWRDFFFQLRQNSVSSNTQLTTTTTTAATTAAVIGTYPVTPYTTAKLQLDLTNGVASILAGQGSSFVMDVNTVGNYIAFAKVGAVYNGVAVAGGGIRPALAIGATGIAMGYNDDAGTWHNSMALDSSTGTASFAGTVNASAGNFTGNVTIGSGGIISSGQTAFNTGTGYWLSGGTTPQFSIGNGSTGMTWDGANFNLNGVAVSTIVSGAALSSTKLNKNASDVLTGAINVTTAGGFNAGTLTWDGAGNITGGSGVAITAKGLVGATGGVATFSIDATTGSALFKGNVDTGGYMHATGSAAWGGTSAAILGSNAINGVVGITSGAYSGVIGQSTSASGSGVTAANQVGGNALNVIGPTLVDSKITSTVATGTAPFSVASSTYVANMYSYFSWGSYYLTSGSGAYQLAVHGTQSGTGTAAATFAAANKPGAATTNTWLTVLFNGVTYYIPAWQ